MTIRCITRPVHAKSFGITYYHDVCACMMQKKLDGHRQADVKVDSSYSMTDAEVSPHSDQGLYSE